MKASPWFPPLHRTVLAGLSLGLAVACTPPNAPPSAPVVSLSPSSPKTSDDLKVAVVAPSVDPEGQAVTYSYQWLKDGAPQADLVTDTVPADRTKKGEAWTVLVTPSDGKAAGTDGTGTVTQEDGHVTVFIAVDHHTAECVGIHAAKVGNRFEALEPLRQAVRARYGAYGPAVAAGLSLRHDHGSQYVSRAFQAELRFLGIQSSPAFVRAPEGNGCAERLIRTLKEQLLWLRPFRNVEKLRQALLDWMDEYNRSWLIERHEYLTPEQARRRHEVPLLAA